MADSRPEQYGAISAPKLASVVARRLEDEVVRRGRPVGEVLGSETELLERFGVSRAVLREAVRIVEHTGAARMRRGPGGGLVVSETNRGAVVAAMGVWFSYIGITISELLEVRAPLLIAACRMAAERAGESGVEPLRTRLELAEFRPGVRAPEVIAIEGAIAAGCGNPALSLLIDSIADLAEVRLATGRARLEPAVDDVEGDAYVAGYRRLVESIAAGDPDAAARLMVRLTDVLTGRLFDAPRRPTRRAQGLPPGEKLAERIAYAIRNDIERASWPVGEVLGSQSDLIERYGVSRAILREAVRILEHHGAVRTKRGPHGGLIVTAPDQGAVVRSARNVLEYASLTPVQLFEARSILEGSAVRLAAARCTPELAVELLRALDAETTIGDAAESFMTVHRGIATVTGNRLFGLFIEVVGALVPTRMERETRTPAQVAAIAAETHRAHVRLVEAIVAGDADLAEKRMERHLRASADVVR